MFTGGQMACTSILNDVEIPYTYKIYPIKVESDTGDISDINQVVS